jgi:hypothetical protein
MSYRLPSTCLWTVAVLSALALADRTTAKPPDLPINPDHTVTPDFLPDSDWESPLLQPSEQTAPQKPAVAPVGWPFQESEDKGQTDWDWLEKLRQVVQQEEIYLLDTLKLDNDSDRIFGDCEDCEGSIMEWLKQVPQWQPQGPIFTLVVAHPSAAQRQHYASTVLFGIHPLLALVPTEDLVDQPCDHPGREMEQQAMYLLEVDEVWEAMRLDRLQENFFGNAKQALEAKSNDDSKDSSTKAVPANTANAGIGRLQFQGDPTLIPAMARLSPTQRQHYASTLLLGIHPLLALVSTEDLVDLPCDHPGKVVSYPLQERIVEGPNGEILHTFGIDQNEPPLFEVYGGEEGSLCGIFSMHWQPPLSPPMPMDSATWMIPGVFCLPLPCRPVPLPRLPQLSATQRQHYASTVLFGIHPLLALIPTEQLVDMPCDHPAVVVQRVTESDVAGVFVHGPGVNSDAGLNGTIVPVQPGVHGTIEIGIGFSLQGGPTYKLDVTEFQPNGTEHKEQGLDACVEALRRALTTETLPMPHRVDGGCEESSIPPMSQMTDDHFQHCIPGVDVMVTGLLKACHQAVDSCRCEHAVDLARQAFALDPQRVKGDPMVNKLHQMANKDAYHAPAGTFCPFCQQSIGFGDNLCGGCEFREPAYCPDCPFCQQPMQPKAAPDKVPMTKLIIIQPLLPTIDPQTVRDLEDLIRAAETEEQEEPTLQRATAKPYRATNDVEVSVVK